jgi:hypothetical protein
VAQPRLRIPAYAADDKSPCDDFPDQLLKLHDRDTIAKFLEKVAQQDQSLRLRSFVVAACREFGWGAHAQELEQLITARTNRPGRQDLLPRDVEWLAAFCSDPATDAQKAAVARELCKLAAERFCEPFPPRPSYYSPHYRREPSLSEKSLLSLLQALLIGGSDEDLMRVIRFVRNHRRIQPGRLPGAVIDVDRPLVAQTTGSRSRGDSAVAGRRPRPARGRHRQTTGTNH